MTDAGYGVLMVINALAYALCLAINLGHDYGLRSDKEHVDTTPQPDSLRAGDAGGS